MCKVSSEKKNFLRKQFIFQNKNDMCIFTNNSSLMYCLIVILDESVLEIMACFSAEL